MINNHLILRDELLSLEGGRFKDLFKNFTICNECLYCGYFNNIFKFDPNHMYRCAVIGRCIGVSLSEELKDYILDQYSRFREANDYK